MTPPISAARVHYRRLKLGWRFSRRFGLGSGRWRMARRLMAGDLAPACEDARCLSAAISWLTRAQDAGGGAGVSAAYYLAGGWDVPYPETSGYLIATLLAYGDLTGNASYKARALRIGDWEIEIQTAGGGVLSRPTRPATRVFNTGQVILGWCCLYRVTGERRFLDAARRSGNYLAGLQEPDGRWEQDTHCGARTYHARIDWALLELANICEDTRYRETALKNIAWVAAQAQENGWFSNCGFDPHAPNTHVIAYTLRGLLECLVIDDAVEHRFGLASVLARSIRAVCRAAETAPVNDIPGMIPSDFDSSWHPDRTSSCLTGSAQLACLLYRYSQYTGDPAYARQADHYVDALNRTVIHDDAFPDISGALAGSYPLFHGYMNQSWPNWATKFWADALMLKTHHTSGFTIPA
jgi:hypothetical protein